MSIAALKNSWIQKAWKEIFRTPKRSSSHCTVRKVYPYDEVVYASMVSTTTRSSETSSFDGWQGVAPSSSEENSLASVGTENILSTSPQSHREVLQQELHPSFCDVVDYATDAEEDPETIAQDAVTDASMLASEVVHSAVQATIARVTIETDMQRTKIAQSLFPHGSGPCSFHSFSSQDSATQKASLGKPSHARTDIFVGSNNGLVPGFLSVIPDSSLDLNRIVRKSSFASTASSPIRQNAQASVRQSRWCQTTSAKRTDSIDQKSSVLDAMDASVPTCARTFYRAETPETVHTTVSSLERMFAHPAEEDYSSSHPRNDILQSASMQVTQDVNEIPEFETPTCLDPSLCSVADILPSLSAVADFQGAWELIDQNQAPDNWLRSFIITGRFYFGGDGSENFLRFSKEDYSILLEGGALSLDDGRSILTRKGKSGTILRFQHFELPTEDMVEEFQGVWSLFGIVADSRSWRPPAWLSNLRIEGRVWKAGHKSGILKLADDGSICLHGDYEIWLEERGDKEVLFLAISIHAFLQYEFKKGVPYPWHHT